MLPVFIALFFVVGFYGFVTRIVPFFIAGLIWTSVGVMKLMTKTCLYLHYRRECAKMEGQLNPNQFKNWKRINYQRIMHANWIGHDETNPNIQNRRKRSWRDGFRSR